MLEQKETKITKGERATANAIRDFAHFSGERSVLRKRGNLRCLL
jgi:hypothetical protein